jgi:hypothetical protein
MNGLRQELVLQETTSLKELLLAHPRALRVIIDRKVPITCSGGSIGDAARASGIATEQLLAEFRKAIDQSGPAADNGDQAAPVWEEVDSAALDMGGHSRSDDHWTRTG